MRDDPPPGVIDRTSRAAGQALSWLFLLSAFLTGYEILVSTAFNAPTIWVHDLTTMLCATAFLFGGAYALERREHIRITPIYDLMPARLQRAADLVSLLLTSLFLAALAWFSGQQAFESISIVERSGHAWNVPMPMIVRTMFFLGTLLLLLQALVLLARRIARR